MRYTNLQNIAQVLTDGSHVIRPLKESPTVKLPTWIAIGFFYFSTHLKVWRLPLIQNLLSFTQIGFGFNFISAKHAVIRLKPQSNIFGEKNCSKLIYNLNEILKKRNLSAHTWICYGHQLLDQHAHTAARRYAPLEGPYAHWCCNGKTASIQFAGCPSKERWFLGSH